MQYVKRQQLHVLVVITIITLSLGSNRGLQTASAAMERPAFSSKLSSQAAAFAPGWNKSKRKPSENGDGKKHLVLIGGGHAHAQVIKAFNVASRPKNLQVTLIDVQKAASYSGMVPGCVSGLYQPKDTLLELEPLADWAGIDFVNDKVVDIDLEQKLISLEGDDKPVPFDAVSLDIGSTSRGLYEMKGAREYTIPTRPISALVKRMEEATDELVQNPRPVKVVVIGGGAAGIELAMSIHGRWEALRDEDFEVTLLDAGQELLPNESDANRQALRKIMSDKGITIKHGCQVQEILENKVCLDSQELIPFSHCIWATGAGAHDLAFNLGERGLAVTERGWVRVNENLQSLSHPHVFAAGDCCSIEGLPSGKSPPKAGVYAVRSGPILIENLSSFLDDDRTEPLTPYHPQDDFLKLLVCGDGKALGFRFGIPLHGKWVFELKNAIDQSFMDLFRAEKLPELVEGEKLDTSQYDAVTETPPQMHPLDAATLLQRTDDDVDFRKARDVIREMSADEEYRAAVLKHVPAFDASYVQK